MTYIRSRKVQRTDPRPQVTKNNSTVAPKLRSTEKTPDVPLRFNYVSLPSANALIKEAYTLPIQIPFEHIKLSIRGIKGSDEIDKLDLHASPDAGDDAGLSIYVKSPQNTRLATIQHKNEKLIFSWGDQLLPTYEREVNAIRSCVLRVKPCDPDADESNTIQIVLNKITTKQDLPTLSRFKTKQAIDLSKEELPFGRPLTIHRCRIDSKQAHPRTGGLESENRHTRTFSIDPYSDVLFHVSLTSSQPNPNNQLTFTLTPDDKTATENALAHLEQISNHIESNSSNARKPQREINDLKNIISVYSNNNGIKYRELILKIDNLLEIIDQFQTDGNSSSLLAKCKTVTTDLKAAVTTLDQLKQFKTNSSIHSIRISISIAMTIEGESVEVVRIGDFKEQGDVDASPAGGPKR